jgi:hypothetical protein
MDLVRGLVGYRACLGACVFDSTGRILLGKRSSNKKQAVGTVRSPLLSSLSSLHVLGR